jgi:ribose 5-phosphate isomerase B
MHVAVGCDHAGFPLKDLVLRCVTDAGHVVVDCGTHSTESVDYPDYAASVAREVAEGRAERGIILCGSGVGACVAANKVRGVRSSVCHDTYSAAQGVDHDDMNVLCLGARIIGPAVIPDLVNAFLGARYSGEERHARRRQKVLDIEAGRWPDSVPRPTEGGTR